MTKHRPQIIKLTVAAALAVLTLCVTLICGGNAEWVSAAYKPFSRGAMRVFGTVWSWLPFSVAEILLYCGVAALVWRLVVFIVRVVKDRGVIVGFLANTALLAAVLYTVFQIGWGINYSASPLADELGMTVDKYPVEALAELAASIAAELNALTNEVPRDESGSVIRAPLGEVADAVRNGYAALYESQPDIFGGVVPLKVKPVLASRAMSFTNIVGIFMPFTGEANVNVDVHPSSIPFTAAHEMAHSIGVAPEDEANFAALLACWSSRDAAVRYSGYLAAFSYVYNAYAGETMDAHLVYETLDDRVRADYAERADYWRRLAETPAMEAVQQAVSAMATAVNDSYIQTMGVAEGVKSYGMVVDLLLAMDVLTNN